MPPTCKRARDTIAADRQDRSAAAGIIYRAGTRQPVDCFSGTGEVEAAADYYVALARSVGEHLGVGQHEFAALNDGIAGIVLGLSVKVPEPCFVKPVVPEILPAPLML